MINYYAWMGGGPNKQKLNFGYSTDDYIETHIFGETIIPRYLRKDVVKDYVNSITELEYIDLCIGHFSAIRNNNSHSNEIEKEKTDASL